MTVINLNEEKTGRSKMLASTQKKNMNRWSILFLGLLFLLVGQAGNAQQFSDSEVSAAIRFLKTHWNGTDTIIYASNGQVSYKAHREDSLVTVYHYLFDEERMIDRVLLYRNGLYLGDVVIEKKDTLIVKRETLDSIESTQPRFKIIGGWKPIYKRNESTDTLAFSRRSPIESFPEYYGQRFTISRNGDFVDSYSAPCGNDGNIHYTVGKWKYNSETQVLETTIPIDKKGKRFKVILVTGDTLKLIKLN